MHTLATLTEQDINPGAPLVDASDYRHRRAVRAVVLDTQDRVALLHVSRKGYHKLPGGGIDEGEDMHVALQRELLEEIGCSADIIAELGIIQEYRDEWQQFQESYCFVARAKDDSRQTAYTQEEIDDGFQPVWASSLEHAIKILETDMPTNYDGQHIKPRDLIILKAAKDLGR